MRNKTITGYCDPFSASAGDTVRFMVSTYAPGDYSGELVRLRGGEGPDGIPADTIDAEFAGRHPGREQPVHPGSMAVIDDDHTLSFAEGLTVAAWIWPTLPGTGAQTIISCRNPLNAEGFRLFVAEDGSLAFEARDAMGDGVSVSTDMPMLARTWYRVSVTLDPSTGRLRLLQSPGRLSPGQGMAARPACAESSIPDGFSLPVAACRMAIAADLGGGGARDHYNGKIDSPRLVASPVHEDGLDRLLAKTPDPALGAALIGHWDFAQGISTSHVSDMGPGKRHGRLINLPARAMIGHNWTGEFHDWRQAPDQYGAIHFHDDDLYDAGWDADFSFVIPPDLPSGVYAARLRHGEDTDYIPFVVRRPVATASAPVAFLVPTASYLAYANYRLRLKANPIFGDGRPTNANDGLLLLHPELGNSTYDNHSDRSGVQYASRLRPVTNMKPGDNRPWGLPADCAILAWLENAGEGYDVITDEDLHMHGEALLKPYRAVVTGTHPEYHSTAMLDAIEGWLGNGGRLMYMGGNGFYWRVAFREDLPGVLEVRRAEDGTRAWIAEPGEYYHAFNGEYGGLWRRIGRAPNRLVGVGFAAQGFEKSGYYRRAAGAANPRVAFMFDGVRGDIFGDHGSIGGGAAGEEIDRFDIRLGSPAHGLVVATSEGLGPDMLRTKEEFLSTIPPFDDPKVRADMTFFECPNGGAVFSTGSITYAASLAGNGYDNDLARITTNVLRRFIDPAPFEMPETD